MKLFVAEIGGIPVSARCFHDANEARSYFDECVLRYVWESDPERPRLDPGFIVREATEDEAALWREGRASAIRNKQAIGLDMNPELYIGTALF